MQEKIINHQFYKYLIRRYSNNIDIITPYVTMIYQIYILLHNVFKCGQREKETEDDPDQPMTKSIYCSAVVTSDNQAVYFRGFCFMSVIGCSNVTK